jgi:hypothetical protein
MFSTELHVALGPERTYRELLARNVPVAYWETLLRPATVLLAIGVVIPMMAVHRVTLRLAGTAVVSWGFAVALEFVAASCVIASASSRRAGMARAIDLWFAGHLPYSLWLLMLPIATTSLSLPALEVIGLTALVPLIWTAFIVTAFCRTVLGTTAAGARWRAWIHLAAVIIVGSTLFIISAGGGAAVLSYTLRRIAE